MEGRHEHFELFDDRLLVVGRTYAAHLLQLGDEPVRIDADLSADEDLVIVRFAQTFLFHQQLFVQFFAGTKPGELDLDVLIGRVAHHLDHVLGERDDLDRFAHVEHEDLAAVRVCARLEHEADRLGYRHKVSDDLGVSDGDGSALFDLLFEQRYHRSVGAEHVAEPDRGELGDRIAV